MFRRTMTGASMVTALMVLAAGCSSKPAPALARPTKLIGSAITAQGLSLSWTYPTSAAPVKHFEVLRNGQVIATLGGKTFTYTDATAWPASTYTYTVKAVGSGSVLPLSSTALTITTVTPLRSQARIVGTWKVTYVVVSSSLINVHPGKPMAPRTWIFKPGCSHGPCDGKWIDRSDQYGHPATGQLSHASGVWLANLPRASLGWCSVTGHKVYDHKDSAQAQLRITAAKTGSDGQWIAAALGGTLRMYYPPENGCIGSALHVTFTGVLEKQ